MGESDEGGQGGGEADSGPVGCSWATVGSQWARWCCSNGLKAGNVNSYPRNVLTVDGLWSTMSDFEHQIHITVLTTGTLEFLGPSSHLALQQDALCQEVFHICLTTSNASISMPLDVKVEQRYTPHALGSA